MSTGSMVAIVVGGGKGRGMKIAKRSGEWEVVVVCSTSYKTLH